MRGRMPSVRACSAAFLAVLTGCSQMIDRGSDAGLISRSANEHGAAYLLPARPLVPNASLQVTPSYSIALENLLYGVAAYYFIDPLSPNWQGELRRLSEDTYSISLRSKRYRSSGGDGEAGRVFRRNADQIVRERGFAGYTIVSFSEGIESEVLGAVRVSEGVIRMNR